MTKADVLAVFHEIGATFILDKNSEGLDYELTALGDNLSVGERQVLSLIRALIFDPKILILDEATANVDTETEAVIQTALNKLTTSRTTIIIAHRLSTIKNADQIVVLKLGEIIESGTSEQLLKTDGAYAKMYHSQVK